jgi:hypothetical protein
MRERLICPAADVCTRRKNIFSKRGKNMKNHDDFKYLQTVVIHKPDPQRGYRPTHPICGGDVSFIQDYLRFIISDIAYERPLIGSLAIDFKGNTASIQRKVRLDLERNYDGEYETNSLTQLNIIRERDQFRQIINESFDLVAATEVSYHLGWLNVSPAEMLYAVPDTLNYACSVIHLGSVGDLFMTILSTENEQSNNSILTYVKIHLLESANYERYLQFNM